MYDDLYFYFSTIGSDEYIYVYKVKDYDGHKYDLKLLLYITNKTIIFDDDWDDVSKNNFHIKNAIKFETINIGCKKQLIKFLFLGRIEI